MNPTITEPPKNGASTSTNFYQKPKQMTKKEATVWTLKQLGKVFLWMFVGLPVLGFICKPLYWLFMLGFNLF